jgi:hypothetical protein
MSAPDFEISAGLRARQLVIHALSEVELAEVGEAVPVTTREASNGFPSPPEQGRPYTDISIERHTIAVTPLK